MRIPMAFVADEANVSQEGKLNVLGIFDRLASSQFPVVHPRMVFVFRLEADYSDSGRTFPVRVTLVDEDEDVLFEAGGDMTAPLVAPGDTATINQVLALVGVQIPDPGVHRFRVEVGELEPHETILTVEAAQPRSTLN